MLLPWIVVACCAFSKAHDAAVSVVNFPPTASRTAMRCGARCGVPTCAAAELVQPVNSAARKDYVVVLMWHDIVARRKAVWFDTTVAEFRAQLDAIRRHGFHVVSLDELYRHLATGAPLPPHALALTFDDNYKGLYRFAYPILREYRWPATFFAHTDFVGVTTTKEHCTWNELREMQNSGLITVQSQTRTHPEDMRRLTDAQLRWELDGSRAALQRHLGRTIYAISYPNGRYDLRVARAIAARGYKIAFMEDWGSAGASRSMLMIHRYSVHRRFKQAIDDLARR